MHVCDTSWKSVGSAPPRVTPATDSGSVPRLVTTVVTVLLTVPRVRVAKARRWGVRVIARKPTVD